MEKKKDNFYFIYWDEPPIDDETINTEKPKEEIKKDDDLDKNLPS